MEISELIKRIKKVQLVSKKIVNTIFLGGYHSTFKGQGLEFSEVRQYVYGDDIRMIDWNVTSRTNSPHIKLMQEERELNIYILIDNCSSMLFGSKRSKKDLALELAAIFSYSASINNDKVGAIIFSKNSEVVIPPKKGKGQSFKIIRAAIDANKNVYNDSSSLDKAIEEVLIQAKKKSIIILISDFLNDEYHKGFKILSSKHQVIPILIKDEIEDIKLKEIPTYKGLSNKTSNTKKMFTSISDDYKQKYEEASKLFKQCNTKPIILLNNDNYFKTIQGYFS